MLYLCIYLPDLAYSFEKRIVYYQVSVNNFGWRHSRVQPVFLNFLESSKELVWTLWWKNQEELNVKHALKFIATRFDIAVNFNSTETEVTLYLRS